MESYEVSRVFVKKDIADSIEECIDYPEGLPIVEELKLRSQGLLALEIKE